MNSEIEK